MKILFKDVKLQVSSIIEHSLRSEASFSLGMMSASEICRTDFDTSGNDFLLTFLDDVFNLSLDRFGTFVVCIF